MHAFRSLDRRACLQSLAGIATAALSADYAPSLAAASAPPDPTADCMILLWMAGGMAHTETFDPKHYEPFSPGIETKRVLSTFPAIDTAVDSIKFTAGLEEMASVMDQGTLIRTFMCPVTDAITHAKHQYHWHTGYFPPLSVAAPHMGAVMARTLGPRNPDLPAFIDIAETFAESSRESAGLRAFLTGGFLGVEHAPFFVPRPEDAARQLASQVGASRGASRMGAFRKLLQASPASDLVSSHQQESMLRAVDQADRLMHSSAAGSFDLSREPKKSYEAYDTGPFGLGCLLARRLVEAGARFIEVHIPYKPFGYWDTHENGHATVAQLKRQIDRPIAQLIRDLRDRGLLDRTLVVLASEFSRDVMLEGKEGKFSDGGVKQPPHMTEPKHYGMHAHFADAGSVLMWGGGIKQGFAYGTTQDEHPCKTTSNPVEIEHLHATIYRAMGISPQQAYEVERRPFYVTRDGVGRPIQELFRSSPARG
jgi:hypothetical protein